MTGLDGGQVTPFPLSRRQSNAVANSATADIVTTMPLWPTYLHTTSQPTNQPTNQPWSVVHLMYLEFTSSPAQEGPKLYCACSCWRLHAWKQKLILKKKKLSCFAGLPFNLNFQTEISSLCILWCNLDVLKSIYLLLNLLPPHPLQWECTEHRDERWAKSGRKDACGDVYGLCQQSFCPLERENQKKHRRLRTSTTMTFRKLHKRLKMNEWRNQHCAAVNIRLGLSKAPRHKVRTKTLVTHL